MVHHEISLGRYMFSSPGILSPDIIAAGDKYPQVLSPSLGVVPVSDHYLFWHLCWKLVYIWELVLWVGMKPWYYPITTKSLVFTFRLVCGCFKSVIIPITTKSSHVCFKQSFTLVFVPFSYPITTIFLYIVFFCVCVFVIVFWILCVCFLFWGGGVRGEFQC